MNRLVVCIVGIASAVLLGCVDAQDTQLTFRYDPRWAAGVSGEIRVRYEPTRRLSSRAMITADLDFSHVSPSALKRLDGRCSHRVTEYQWHIHTNWSAPHSSGAFADCSPRLAGNHYDPSRACGPNSEYAGTKYCMKRSGEYHCTPSRYKEYPNVCEKGDLSGKLGNFVLGENMRVKARWVDPYFPARSEVSSEWNIILHPVCGRAAPRFACAVLSTQGK